MNLLPSRSALFRQVVLDCAIAIRLAGRENLLLVGREDLCALPLEAQVVVVAARVLQAGRVTLCEATDIVLDKVIVHIAGLTSTCFIATFKLSDVLFISRNNLFLSQDIFLELFNQALLVLNNTMHGFELL